ncbi:MAG: gliding motility-associated C-terminal domain-containing protein [Bacteroidetes bacterium]|nr:gliding motility-associated C-terminal domain-containing protein [Bacteroidota bacterium]
MKPSANYRMGLPLAGLLTFLPALLFSQNLSYQNPAEFFVCDAATFEFTVQNTTGVALTGVGLTVDFSTGTGTPCGVAYVPGTVTGAAEGNISNLSAPVFQLGNLAAGAVQTVTVSADASCLTAQCIDNAEVFVNNLTLTWNGGSTALTTNPYVVERALLVVTAVNSTVMTGTRDDLLQRKITIQNTRPGALAGFVFTDVYQPGISISSAQGTDISPAPDTFRMALGAANFAAIGDGDGLFEFNETIVVTEDILVEDCGVDITSAVSNITAGWGCSSGPACQQAFINAVVLLEPYAKKPNLAWQPIVSVPECFCGPDGYQQGMKITNAGQGKALDVALHVIQTLDYLSGFVDTASVIVDSAGTLIDFNVNFSGSYGMTSPCVAPGPVSPGFSLTIPVLEPGETVTVFWDLYFCEQGCQQPNAGWEYKYSYFKECPPSPFIQAGDWIGVGEYGIWANSHTNIVYGDTLKDDSTYTFNYELTYDSLALLDDQLVLQFKVPCGMNWDVDNELLLNGQAPTDLTLAQGDTFLFVTAVYDLPLNANVATTQFDITFDCEDLCLATLNCRDSLETSCTAFDTCGIEGLASLAGLITASIMKCADFPTSCNLQTCTSFGGTFECILDSVCIHSPPGYVSYAFEAARKNYGLVDNNNDRVADGPGPPDLNLVERHRLVAGDTIRTVLRGLVVGDIPGAAMPFGNIEIFFWTNNSMSNENRTLLLEPQNGIQLAGSTLRIFDKSANTWYECNDPVPLVLGELVYLYDLSAPALGGCVPPNFAFADGDSILFEGNYRIEHNLFFDNDPDPLRGDIILSPQMRVFDADTTDYTPVKCGCTEQKFSLTGYEYTIQPGVFALPPCNPSQFAAGSLVRIRLHEGNFFPYEFRNLMVAENWQVQVPPTVQINTARLTFLLLQDGVNLFSNQILPPTIVNGEYVYDLLPFQTPGLDEGFSALFQYIFESDCENKGSMPLMQTSTFNFAPGLPEPVNPLDFSIQTNGLRALIANLSIEAPLFDIVSFNNQLQLDFELKNTPTIVASQSSGPATNAWLYVTSPSGLVTNFQLLDLTTGLPVPGVGGIFQLGNFPIDTSGAPFRLLGLNNSCELEYLQIHYGWHCTPFHSTVQTPCYEQIQPVTLLSPPGEIDMLIESPIGCSDLCDTIPYHFIEVFNAQLGAVYDLRLTALLPPGMGVVSGSCAVEYPTGSGQLYPIGDPVILGAGVAEWNLSMLFDTIAGGLPGVSSAPLNSLTLRFLGETTCDFVADAYVLFIAAAEQNCGSPTNTIAKPGDPLCIEGVSGNFTTSISVTAVPGFGCNDALTFEVSLANSDTLPPGACLIVTLPPGVFYQQGSCEAVCQASANCPPVVNGSLLTFALPAGVPPNQILCFRFGTIGWAGLGCENGVVLFRSAAETQALCALTGDSCSTKVSTGSLILPFDPMRPEFDLSNFTVTASSSGANDLVNFNVDVTNSGGASQPPTVLQFFIDTDGNGSGDLLVHTESIGTVISGGQTLTVSGSFLLPAGNLCRLLAVVDPALQCACAGDVAFVNLPIEYQTGQDWTVCSGADQVVGVAAMPGFSYQWSPDDCLADPTAASTVFNCVNNSGLPVTYHFTLTEGDGDCEILNLIDVTVQPVPGIFYAETPICAGESANLVATDGVSYNWQGPGIAQPDLQVQTVMPAAASTYSVTVADAFGCTGSESVTVEVNQLPVVDAGADMTFCPGQMDGLNATFDVDFDYLWSPVSVGGLPALSDPTIANPLVLTNQTTTFSLLVTDENGCSAMDEVTVSFADSLLLTMPPDVTICAGSSTTLVVTSNAPASFAWSPDGTCINPPTCSNLLVTPSSTTTYFASATSTDGCMATGSVTVTVVTDNIVTNGPPVEICEGETTVIFGETVSEPGVYCDTFTVVGSCDSVYCVALLLKPDIDTTLFLDTICAGLFTEFFGQILTQEGEYCVNLQAQNGCDSTICLQLSLLPAPDYNFSLPDTVSQGDTLVMTIPPGDYSLILWFMDSIEITECMNQTSCTVIAQQDANYIVSYSGLNGCNVGGSEFVTVVPACDPEKAEVPNAFSPNGDDLNDSFHIVSLGSETILNMRIWNRWGEKVYDGPGPWDGTQDGKPAASDVYVYLIKVGCAVSVEVEEKVLKGDVTLLR